jgi:hypothetical protein
VKRHPGHPVKVVNQEPSAIEFELRVRLGNIIALAQSVAEGRVKPRHFREYARLCCVEATTIARLLEDVHAIAEATRANSIAGAYYRAADPPVNGHKA